MKSENIDINNISQEEILELYDDMSSIEQIAGVCCTCQNGNRIFSYNNNSNCFNECGAMPSSMSPNVYSSSRC